jgi:glycosyltransferase involved in cell wall biosynthesis
VTPGDSMGLPKVSVLIPCYNAEKYVGETLESVFRQAWPELEVIVVDDGSTDGSADVVRSFARPNLRLIQQANRGQTAALNVCCSHATGEFVQYLDADDLIDPEKIALQMARLQDAPRCIATAEWGRFHRTPQETQFKEEPVWRDLSPIDWLAISRLRMMFPALWLLPMSIVRTIGTWREDLTLNNDAEYFTRAVLAAERVLFCAGARCHYRSGIPGSLSGSRTPRHFASQFTVLDLCESYIRAVEDSERVRRGFAVNWQEMAHYAYPYDQAVATRALDRAKALHPIRTRPDGGLRFRAMSRIIGWRAARVLQVRSGRP